jgi:hypothetical protein
MMMTIMRRVEGRAVTISHDGGRRFANIQEAMGFPLCPALWRRPSPLRDWRARP